MGDVSRQTKNFKAKSKRSCHSKIEAFLAEFLPYSTGPDGGPGVPGECMECKEIRRIFKKPPMMDFTKKPICRVVGECVVVDSSDLRGRGAHFWFWGRF